MEQILGMNPSLAGKTHEVAPPLYFGFNERPEGFQAYTNIEEGNRIGCKGLA